MNQNRSFFDKLIHGDQGNNNTPSGNGEVVSVTDVNTNKEDEVEEKLDEAELGAKGFLDKCFKEPKAGSVLMKMKKGELKGKSASGNYEKVLGDYILGMQSTDVHKEIFLLSRLCLGQVNALKLAEAAQKAVLKGASEKEIFNYLFNDKLDGMSGMAKYMRSLLPYHKDLVINHAGFFARIGLGI